MMNSRYVTITTDASFCPELKIASWAIWISHYNGPTKKSGVFKNICNNSTEAEFKAIINSLHILKASKISICYNTNVIINTDSKTCIQMINTGKVTDKFLELHFSFLSIKNTLQFKELKSSHVKAHTNNPKKARNWVNNWCDIECKNLLRIHRQKIKNEQLQNKNT